MSSVTQRQETSAATSVLITAQAQPPSVLWRTSTVEVKLPSQVAPEATSRQMAWASLTRTVTSTGADEVTSRRAVSTVVKCPQ